MLSWFTMIYSRDPSKIPVLSPDSSASILMIWFAVLSDACTPSPEKPNEKKSATIGLMSPDSTTLVVSPTC